MRLFLWQLSGELRRLFARPRARLGFAAVLAFEFVLSLAYRHPAARAMLLHDARRLHIDVENAFSGLTSGSYLVANAAMTVGTFFIALIGADLLGQDAEEGTLRMALCRPVSRARLYLQKAFGVAVYALAMGALAGLASLFFGLIFEGPGPLYVIIVAENILGTFPPGEGLQRYLLAITLLPPCLVTVALLGLALSCFRMKPATATAGVLTYLLAEGSLRRLPQLALIREYSITSRLATWMNCFNQIIPDQRILRDLLQLTALNLLLLLVGWLAFRRREFKP